MFYSNISIKKLYIFFQYIEYLTIYLKVIYKMCLLFNKILLNLTNSKTINNISNTNYKYIHSYDTFRKWIDKDNIDEEIVKF